MTSNSNFPLSAPSAQQQSQDKLSVRKELVRQLSHFINSSDYRFGVMAVTPGGGKTYSTSKVFLEFCDQDPSFISFLKEKTAHLLHAFNSDEIDVVISDYPDFLLILLYSIRVASLQIYFSMGFVYFEFEGVDYLLVSKEEKSNNTIKTSIIDYESYNWLESRFLERPNTKDGALSNLDITFYPAVKQLTPPAKYIIGCYGRFELISKEYLSVMKTTLSKKDDIIFFVFGPSDQSLATNYFTRNGLQDRMIISGTSDPHVFG